MERWIKMTMRKSIIALDADGVLLDYSSAYATAWERAFGARPTERDPTAYWPIDRWNVPRLSGAGLERFRACFDDQFWSAIPAIGGALEACIRMHHAGYDLICISALEARFEASRLRNLRDLGFPIERVIATPLHATADSPKASVLNTLMPIAFVDDYLPYFRGVAPGVHKALIHRQRTGSPNVGLDLSSISSEHADLAGFADWWLTRYAA
jgi:hypothetical protein